MLTPPPRRSSRTAELLRALGTVAVLAVVGSSCAAEREIDSAAQAATVAPPTTPVPGTTVPPTSEAAATTTAAPAEESSSTVAIGSLPPAETTIAPSTVPASTVPAHVVGVAPAATPLVAVGTADGADTAAVQQRLVELGFWLSGVDGEYGLTTTQAVMALQKYWGLDATGRVDDATVLALTAMDHRAHATATAGDLVEVDKTRQLLFIVKGGYTVWTINASTGTEVPYETVNKKDPTKIERGDSVTPVGTFDVYRERAEGWWEGDLGEIYRPKYFRGGVAVHGSRSIPNRPASHGCVRVSVPAMDMIWATGLVPLKTTVWVHGAIPNPPDA